MRLLSGFLSPVERFLRLNLSNSFSILVRSGFTKRQAMGSQFLTAIGAFLG